MARKIGKIKRIVMLDRNGFLGVPPETPIKFLMTADTFDFLERSAAAMAIDRGQLLMSIIVGEYLNPEKAVLLRTTEGLIGDGYLTVLSAKRTDRCEIPISSATRFAMTSGRGITGGFENSFSAASGDVTTEIRHPLESRRDLQTLDFLD